MDYALKTDRADDKRNTLISAARALAPLLAGEKTNIAIAVACVIVTSASNLLAPALIAHVVDTAIPRSDYGLLLRYAGLLAVAILAGSRPALRQKLQEYRAELADQVRQQSLT